LAAISSHASQVTLIIFGLSYAALAVGKVPGLKTDRAGVALVGATALLAARLLSWDQAMQAIDWQTLGVLFGMMIIVGCLQISGCFAALTHAVAEHFTRPYVLLAAIIVTSGVLSAFLINDVVCVALTPLVLELCRRTRHPPVPYLMGLATAANIGSVATITGNPQNIIIGSLSGISYTHFLARLGPVACVGLVLDFVVVAWIYRAALRMPVPALVPATAPVPHRAPLQRILMLKTLAVTLAVVALFLAGAPTAISALGGAAILLLGRTPPKQIYKAVDWPLLVMFAGLFIIVRGFEIHGLGDFHPETWHLLSAWPVATLTVLATALSNLVSNVPAVLVLKSFVTSIPAPEQAWLTLAMASTLAGNITILGSVANLIVVENAKRDGVRLGFLEYLRVGLPLSVLTLVVGATWLAFGPV